MKWGGEMRRKNLTQCNEEMLFLGPQSWEVGMKRAVGSWNIPVSKR